MGPHVNNCRNSDTPMSDSQLNAMTSDHSTASPFSHIEPEPVGSSTESPVWRPQLAEDNDGETIARGTRVTLYLKEDAAEYADEKKLGALIKQYSEFIAFPIKLWSSKCDLQPSVPEWDQREGKKGEGVVSGEVIERL